MFIFKKIIHDAVNAFTKDSGLNWPGKGEEYCLKTLAFLQKGDWDTYLDYHTKECFDYMGDTLEILVKEGHFASLIKYSEFIISEKNEKAFAAFNQKIFERAIEVDSLETFNWITPQLIQYNFKNNNTHSFENMRIVSSHIFSKSLDNFPHKIALAFLASEQLDKKSFMMHARSIFNPQILEYIEALAVRIELDKNISMPNASNRAKINNKI